MSAESEGKPLIGLVCGFDAQNDWYYLPAEYSQAIAAAGGVAVLIPLIPTMAPELASRLEGFVLSGCPVDVDPVRYGQGWHPEVKAICSERDETDFAILEGAFREKKPILGICFGVQSLNVFLGGTLIQHIPEALPSALEHQDRQARHAVLPESGSRISDWAGAAREIVVNSSHHQSIQNLGRGLKVTARSPDGVIEAVEGNFPEHFVLGVQWHPERIWEQEKVSRRIFAELIRAALECRHAATENGDRALKSEIGNITQ